MEMVTKFFDKPVVAFEAQLKGFLLDDSYHINVIQQEPCCICDVMFLMRRKLPAGCHA